MGRSQSKESRSPRVPERRPVATGNRLQAILNGLKWLMRPEVMPRESRPADGKGSIRFLSWLLAAETMPRSPRRETPSGHRGGSWLLGFEPMPARRPGTRGHDFFLKWLLRPEPFPTRKHSEAKHGSR